MYEKFLNWMKDHSGEVTIVGYAVGIYALMKWCAKLTAKAITDGIKAALQ